MLEAVEACSEHRLSTLPNQKKTSDTESQTFNRKQPAASRVELWGVQPGHQEYLLYTQMAQELKKERQKPQSPGTHTLLHTPASGLSLAAGISQHCLSLSFFNNALFAISSWAIWTVKESQEWLWGCYHGKQRDPNLPFHHCTPGLSSLQHSPPLWKSVPSMIKDFSHVSLGCKDWIL